MLELANVPSVGDEPVGTILDADELQGLVRSFKNSPALYPIIATAARTGARRSEILALRVCDLDAEQRTLRIERTIEDTKKHGLRIKPPKTQRGVRTIEIDGDLRDLLVRQQEKLQRLKAGVPDNVEVDLSLVKLPDDALLFPAPPKPGAAYTFTELRRPRNVTKEFDRKVKALG